MAYLRCTECGSKALTAASQCPRCAHPFDLRDARGERVKLVACRGCGIMHRFDTPCHWCGDLPPVWRVSGAQSIRVAAVALMLVAAGGVWRYHPLLQELASVVMSSEQSNDTNAQVVRDNGKTMAPQLIASEVPSTMNSEAPFETRSEAPSADAASPPSDLNNPLPKHSADSIVWTPAVARTWVNVRSDASRAGEVVGVIKPDSRTMLGTDSAGWRQVRLSDVSGWVDPRLFEADSLRSRGERSG